MRASHPLGQHLSTCSSPDNCEEFLSIHVMAATSPEAYRRHLIADSARQAAARRAPAPPPVPVDDYTPPDPYNIEWPADVEPDPLDPYAPLDPYHIEGDK